MEEFWTQVGALAVRVVVVLTHLEETSTQVIYFSGSEPLILCATLHFPQDLSQTTLFENCKKILINFM